MNFNLNFVITLIKIFIGYALIESICQRKEWYVKSYELPDLMQPKMNEILDLQTDLFQGHFLCGDGICNTEIGESCETCSFDCGYCKYQEIITSCKHKNHVTLTFDDGPSEYTPNLLEILKRENIQATFFINGAKIALDHVRMSLLIQQIYSEGHVIGTHTYNHVGLVTGVSGFNEPSPHGYVELEEIRMEMMMNDIMISEALNLPLYPRAFRPPYLEMNSTVLALLESFGYIPISINVDSSDWIVETTPGNSGGSQRGRRRRRRASTSAQRILENILTSTHAISDSDEGIIVLQHDTYQSSIDAVPLIIQYYRSLEMEIVPLSTCLGYSDTMELYKSKDISPFSNQRISDVLYLSERMHSEDKKKHDINSVKNEGQRFSYICAMSMIILYLFALAHLI